MGGWMPWISSLRLFYIIIPSTFYVFRFFMVTSSMIPAQILSVLFCFEMSSKYALSTHSVDKVVVCHLLRASVSIVT